MHNSFQILAKNIELAKKELTLAESVDKEMADYLVGDALENIVSAFDGFGREVCFQKAADIHFQNLSGARRRVQEAFKIDFADVLAPVDWERACRVFQKRHLLAHKMGVIDAEYVQKTNDPNAVAGREIGVSRDEVTWMTGMLEALGRRLFEGVLNPSRGT